MTNKEFKELCKGDIVSQNRRYYIVMFPSEDSQFIDCQELCEIGKKIPELGGYQHSNINYRYASVVKDTCIIQAINIWCESYFNDEPYSFINGFIRGINGKDNIS